MRHPIRLDNDSESFDFEFTDERAKACLIEVKTFASQTAHTFNVGAMRASDSVGL